MYMPVGLASMTMHVKRQKRTGRLVSQRHGPLSAIQGRRPADVYGAAGVQVAAVQSPVQVTV